MAEVPQRTALRLQLAMIAGNEPPTSLFEIRSKRRAGGMSQTFISVRDIERAERTIMNRSQTTDVFIGAAPRGRESGTADAIEPLWCLRADCDTADAGERLRAFQPAPNIIVRSGTGDHLHGWWQLSAPLEPAQAVRANRRLALALGADRAATDAARIMRPIGSRNWKTNPPLPVECTRLEIDSFCVADIVSGLEDDPAYTPKPLRRHVIASADPNSALAGLARVVREASEGERNAKLNWAAYRAAEHALNNNEAETELLAAALAAGLPEPEALRTISSGLTAGERVAA